MYQQFLRPSKTSDLAPSRHSSFLSVPTPTQASPLIASNQVSISAKQGNLSTSKDPARVAFYITGLRGGGAERVVVNLIRNFAQQGFKVDLLLNAVTGPYLSEVPPEVRILEMSRRSAKNVFKVMHYLRQERPVALFASLHYCTEIAVLAKRLSGVSTRIVVSERNTLSLCTRNSVTLRDRLMPLGARLTYRCAEGIVAVSHGVAQDLAQLTGLPLSRIQVIYNPTVTPSLLEKAQEPLDHPWFAPGEPPVILGVGRLAAQKDFPTLIRAFARVRQVRPARLMILGQGEQLSELKDLVNELGLENDVALPGFKKNPYPYMARAAAFVLSSAWEGLPNVLIEAMAVGTPVISTDCPSGAAEILDNGKYGALVPVGDTNALADAMLSVLSGDYKRVDPNWMKQFTSDTVTQQYLDVLGLSQTTLNQDNGIALGLAT